MRGSEDTVAMQDKRPGRNVVRSLVIRAYRRLRPWLESLEHDEMAGRAAEPAGLHHFPTFLCRLIEEAARAERYHLEFGVVVFHLPPAAAEGAQRAELEAALRSYLRKADIPGRLSEDLLAVLLPETGRKAPEAAQRIARLLSEAGGAPVRGGYARFPEDGQRVSDLLRIATERCTGADQPDLMARLES